jgi:hypothetical protein
MMKTRYRLKTLALAILDMPGYEQILVTLPADAVLEPSVKASALSAGWLAVYWEGKHYSVYKRGLARKNERVSAA